MAAPETGLLDGRLLPGRIPDEHVESLATAEENLGKRDREVKDRGDGDRWDEAAELTEASSSDGPGGRGHCRAGTCLRRRQQRVKSFVASCYLLLERSLTRIAHDEIHFVGLSTTSDA